MTKVDGPMFDAEAEQQALGVMIYDHGAVLASDLQPHHFGEPIHARIMAALRAIDPQDGSAAQQMVSFAMREDAGMASLGGPAYIGRLIRAMVHTTALPALSRHIMALWARREAISAMESGIEALRGTDAASDPQGALAGVSGALMAIDADAGRRKTVRSWGEAMLRAVEVANEGYQNEGHAGLRFGLTELDDILSGLGKGDMAVLAGRPSMGKSAVAIWAALEVAKRGEPVVIASLEMTREQIAMRFISAEMRLRGHGVPYTRLRSGAMSEDEFRRMIEVTRDYEKLPVKIIEPTVRELGRLRSAMVRACQEPPGLIVIDYLQQIQAPGRSRYEQVSAVSNAIKAMAVEHAAPVLCLSQLSRGVEERKPPRPQMGDLRDSGEIEQDADQVILCYRPEYYLSRDDNRSVEAQAALDASKGMMELIVAKNRHGRIATARVGCDIAFNTFHDLEKEEAGW